MIESWTRERGQINDSRAPISPALLEKICQQWLVICRDEYEAVLFRAAVLLTSFSTLRISEVVATGKGNVSKVALQWHDIKLKDNVVWIHIR